MKIGDVIEGLQILAALDPDAKPFASYVEEIVVPIKISDTPAEEAETLRELGWAPDSEGQGWWAIPDGDDE